MKTLKEEVEEQIETYTFIRNQYGVFDGRYDEADELVSLFERILDNLKSNE